MNMKLSILVPLLALLNWSCAPVPAQVPHTATPMISTILKSNVRIATSDSGCSGWVLKGSHKVITAAHCFGDDLTVDFGDGKLHPATVEKKGSPDGIDLMVLDVPDEPQTGWPEGLATCTFPPFYGENLTMFGQPLGVPNSVSWGKVSLPDFSFNKRHLIEYDGRNLPGNSGGAVVDTEENCVMGVAELILVADPDDNVPYGMSFLTPVSLLEKL